MPESRRISPFEGEPAAPLTTGFTRARRVAEASSQTAAADGGRR